MAYESEKGYINNPVSGAVKVYETGVGDSGRFVFRI